MFDAVQRSLLECKITSKKPPPPPPTAAQKEALEEIVAYLKPPQILTDLLQSNKIMASRVIIAVQKCLYDINEIKPKSLATFKDKLVANIKTRFEPVLKQKCYILAAILDPRVKNKPFQMNEKCLLKSLEDSEARQLLQLELECLPLENQTSFSQLPHAHNAGQNAEGQKRHENDLDFMNKTVDQISKQLNQMEGDFEKYLKETCLGAEDCPLVYWKKCNKLYPRLASLAKIYLSVPPSSGDVERLFSVAGTQSWGQIN